MCSLQFSFNLGRCVVPNPDSEEGEMHFDYERLKKNVRVAIRQLDRVIDRNFYPIEKLI